MVLIRMALRLSVCAYSSFLYAQPIIITPDKNLSSIITSASDGDVYLLKPGEYLGNFVVNKEITIRGEDSVKIIGSKKGSVITVNASNVTIENLIIVNSGINLASQDSAIFVNKNVNNTLIQNNTLINNLIGVYLWGSTNSSVINNKIVGKKDLRENERGNGIQLWNSPGSKVSFNDISYGRDGIFVTTSKDNIFNNNIFHNLRYSIHYMYTNNSSVKNNVSIGNDIGYALMSSNKLNINNNISINDKEHGLFFNYLNDSKINGNVVINGKHKCLFVYNSNFNIIINNYFRGCLIGVNWTAGSDENEFYDNAFIGNYKQVKYISTKNIEWSYKGKGNYWSNHHSYDMNNNGIADSAYKPNDITDKILWNYPNAAILLNSPIMQLLKYSSRHFPSLLPGGILDSYPLMSASKIAIGTLKNAKKYID
ncbi:nitrous oxide reductase family maturation protein NosD [bacterium endosymbiont of Bathymodiolus sp. 5 South]|jgi:nitrous oxidase accessory protein|uniref:nitrous oxide reductase family maturation protein NosD n=1 Tax=bacterium endosymbiont of Bathymodiolus sp. 5 South TaxID=1181670 RepID=UPI0010BB4C16|nr:nitrous oxide reductase family maturation protein NosD [bacterium endosymbiont of Bathymodiolus sp. 5 South]SHN89683.1 Nitrous oxide reductase maturation protein NosD [bacterium endosymbiont of Bathymodiolus sp. 5 South]VVH59747.1 Nitrous oxide reductase maturation protein NosD [uncultured Gammaproteobacteria bacterium]